MTTLNITEAIDQYSKRGAIALYFVYYNFVKIHSTLRVPPAMQAGLIKGLMSIEDIGRLTEGLDK